MLKMIKIKSKLLVVSLGLVLSLACSISMQSAQDSSTSGDGWWDYVASGASAVGSTIYWVGSGLYSLVLGPEVTASVDALCDEVEQFRKNLAAKAKGSEKETGLQEDVVQKIECYRVLLCAQKEDLSAYMRRFGKPQEYVSSVRETYKKNVERIELDQTKAYETLGLTQCDRDLSSEQLARLISHELEDKKIDEKRKSVLRQVRYFFGRPYLKEEYDAFLQGDKALALLCRDMTVLTNQEELKRCQATYLRVITHNAELVDLKRKLQAAVVLKR